MIGSHDHSEEDWSARLGRPTKGQRTYMYPEETGEGGGSDTIHIPGMCGTCNIQYVALHCTFTGWLMLRLDWASSNWLRVHGAYMYSYIIIRMAKGRLCSN